MILILILVLVFILFVSRVLERVAGAWLVDHGVAFADEFQILAVEVDLRWR